MKPHLVFTGANRVGKTTFIGEWVKQYPEYIAMRAGPTPNHNAGREQFNVYARELVYSDRPQAWDRGHLDEIVYAPIFRPNVLVDNYPLELLAVEHLPFTRPVVTVYVEGTFSDFCQVDDEERYGLSLEAELDRWEYALQVTHLPVIRLSLRGPSGWYALTRTIGTLEGELDNLLKTW